MKGSIFVVMRLSIAMSRHDVDSQRWFCWLCLRWRSIIDRGRRSAHDFGHGRSAW